MTRGKGDGGTTSRTYAMGIDTRMIIDTLSIITPDVNKTEIINGAVKLLAVAVTEMVQTGECEDTKSAVSEILDRLEAKDGPDILIAMLRGGRE